MMQQSAASVVPSRGWSTSIGLRALAAAAILCVVASWQSPAAAQSTDPEQSAIWQKVRVSLFESRPISTAAGEVVVLEAPNRAEDAAVVPIAIRAQFDQTPERFIEKLYLIVDKNPSPVSAVFTLSPVSGRADIETRIRVEDYSHIRAVAQLNDGSLFMASRYIKASGGCSAPAGRDLAQAMATLGKWKFRVEGEPVVGKPLQAQLMISHPNVSGLAMDQLTRHYAPPHFVRRVDVRYAGTTVLSADIDFSISENPHFRFFFTPQKEGGRLEVEFVDNQDLEFKGSVAVNPLAQAGNGAADLR